MAPATLVDSPVELGRQFLQALVERISVDLAFWHQEQEEPFERLLFIHSEDVNEKNRALVWEAIFRIASQVRMDPSNIRLIGKQHPMLIEAYCVLQDNEATLPLRLLGNTFTGWQIDPFHFYKIPGELTMATAGIDTLHSIIDEEAAFFEREGRDPRKMKLPVLMAYELAKCGRGELGELAGKIFKDGIHVLERDGFHGMQVEIVRDRDAKLELE